MTSQINILQNRINEQEGRIIALEQASAQDNEFICALRDIIATQGKRINEQEERIIGAETRNEMNAQAIYDLQQEVVGQAKRIEQLETETALSKEQRLQVIANAAVIGGINRSIGALAHQVARCPTRLITLGQRIKRLETDILDFHERVGKLEAGTCGLAAIETVKALGLGIRVEKLEAMLWDVAKIIGVLENIPE